ncbi:hypothetical protein B7494_g6606 [Chlorociboria aeruginascens]|nr:hypothetical protein B7494_g6606 [Chlorociboria aeruginascens]
MPINIDSDEEIPLPSVYRSRNPSAASTPRRRSQAAHHNRRHPLPTGRSLPATKKMYSREECNTQLVDWLTQTDPYLSGVEILALAKRLTGVTRSSFSWLSKRYQSIAKRDTVLGQRIRDCNYKNRGARIASGQSSIDSPYDEEKLYEDPMMDASEK